VITKLRKRIESEKGFTLIEMLIVIIILGILLAIAVPAYLKFKDRANNNAAAADIRAMIPAVEAYNADNNGYAGMQIGGTGASSLQATYDTALKGAPTVTILSKSASTYCIRATVGNATAYKSGPSGDIVVNPSSATCS
jgi:type IV pilus assembly protein PilA